MSIKAFNLNDIKTTKPKTQTNTKKEFVTEGAYRCKIIGMTTSEQKDNYSGSPFIEFEIVTEDNKNGRCRFWVIKETDSPKSAEWKAKSLKEFLVNAGVTNFATDNDAFDGAIGKWINVVFTFEEYLTTDRETGKPRIGKMIRYRWSSKDKQQITYNPDYNKPLSMEDKQQYQYLLEQSNQGSSLPPEDDVPF